MTESMSRRGLLTFLGSLVGLAAVSQATTASGAAGSAADADSVTKGALPGEFPVRSVDGLGRVTTYVYDSSTRLVSILHPRESHTTFVYDAHA